MSKQQIINLVAQIFMFSVNLCISFFLVPYITKVIGVEAYGFVGLANDFVGYAQIVTIAINSMASRFITIKLHEGSLEEANKYYSSVMIANIIISIVLSIVGLIFILTMDSFINIPSGLVSDVKFLFALIFANFIISILTSSFAVSTFCTNKLYLSSIKTIISQIIKVVILLGTFIILKPAVSYIGIATVIATAYLGYCNYRYSKSLTPELKISKKYFDIGCIKTLISSGIWNTLTKLSGILSSGLDLFIANTFIGSIGMGIMSVSRTIPNTILNAFGSITSVFTPELTISYAKKKNEEMMNQLLYAIKLLGVFSALPMTILFAYGDIFYSLWVPSQNATILYALTCVTVLGLSLSLPLEPLWNLFTATNKVKESSLYLLLNSVLTIIMVFVLINIFPSKTVRMFIICGVSTLFTIIRSLTFLPIYGATIINLKKTTFFPVIIKNVIAIIVSTIFALGIKKLFTINSWLTLVIAVAVASVVTMAFSFMIITKKEEREKIKETIQRKIKKEAKV